MKRAIYGLLMAFLVYLGGWYWSVRLTDQLTENDYPSAEQVSVARLLWKATPALSMELDAERVLKLSGHHATAQIYKNQVKDPKQVIRLLDGEFTAISSYLRSHGADLPDELQARFVVQLLMYLNRLQLYLPYSADSLESALARFAPKIGTADIDLQEDWYRERMIRAKLESREASYADHRSNLWALYDTHAADLPVSRDFVDGIKLFYDGLLSCVSKETSPAVEKLAVAATKFAQNREYATLFLNRALIVLMLGRGMDSGPRCREAIRNVISSA